MKATSTDFAAFAPCASTRAAAVPARHTQTKAAIASATPPRVLRPVMSTLRASASPEHETRFRCLISRDRRGCQGFWQHPRMFDHLTLRVSDRDASGEFYRLVLAELGHSPTHESLEYIEWDDFGVLQANAGNPPTTNLHIGFAAASRELVEAFWRSGTENGHPSDGEPGMRTQYRDDYYGAFLLDPDGNSV